MSGPKRSQYTINASIRREIAAERRREYERRQSEYRHRVEARRKEAERRRNEYLERVARREAAAKEKAEVRAGKEVDLRNAIKECRNQLHVLVKEYGSEPVDAQRVESWLVSAENHAKDDLRIGWQELNGAKSFLTRKEGFLKKRPVQLPQEEIDEVAEPSEAELLLSELDDVLSDNPAVSNPGIIQRLDLMRGAVKVNRENPNTLEQVKTLLAKVNEMVEEYEIRKKEREFAIRAFAEVVGAEPPAPDAGQAALQGDKHLGEASQGEKRTAGGGFTPASFSGSISGMPITVVFEDGNNIRLNTPEGGDCKTPLKTLMNKLAEKGIELGSVRIDRTGENWNPVSTGNVQNRMRA